MIAVIKKLFPLVDNERWRELSGTEKKAFRREASWARDPYRLIPPLFLAVGMLIALNLPVREHRLIVLLPFALAMGLAQESRFQHETAKRLQGLGHPAK